ncbi:15749_t:CDS:2 [Acaulospora morrowiae]|uniref:15749_t:CDS:1 n=1 Tax=Acaulospora morrowiae TaxID=94023 RepID=A0A9N8Z875_9GLOM|nr:15749_t:CDS:2 [Acaulospora morrowiae]
MFNTSDHCDIPEGNNVQGWVLTFASGLACCMGALVVYSDIFFQKFLRTPNVHITQDSSVLVASLSLGAELGTQFFSSFHTLMNESKQHFEKANYSRSYSGLYMIGFYFVGVVSSILINCIIHRYIPEGSALHSHHHDSPESGHKVSMMKSNSLSLQDEERSSLLRSGRLTKIGTSPYGASDDDVTRLEDIRDFNGENGSNECSILVEDESYHHHAQNDRRSPGVDQERSQLMSIGIQTALAISIHKFPEGLITFVSSKVSPSLGMALFLAIALHNISEGITMALPLYMATGSRSKSFIYTSLLGGLSQPLGALVGWFFLKESASECWNHDFVYGALFGAVGGLMAVICIQGMLPPAIRHDKSNGSLVGNYFFLGVMIMGLSSALLNHARISNPQ